MCHGRHQRTFCRVAVAATAKNAPQLASPVVGDRPERHQNLFNGIRCVRVVNHHQRCICFAERIQATFDVLTMQMRLRSREREALKDVLLKLGYGRAYPFRHDADRDPPYHTALIDLLEIMEFVAEEGQWASAAPR